MQRYRRISQNERCQIFAFKESQVSVAEIAKRLKLHRSSVYREIRRNGGKNYEPVHANEMAKTRFKACRRKRRMSDEGLNRKVTKLLFDELTPDQISGRIWREKKISISHQTIYNEIENYRPELKPYLRKFGWRPGRGRGERRRRHHAWKKSIHDRPISINERKSVGHWERDTMFTKDRKTLIVCLDRKSRFILVDKVKLPYRDHLTTQTLKLIARARLEVKSFTNDNGNEFMDGAKLDVPVYYCDPHAPHQKGSVENAIGLLRNYIKRSTDLETMTAKDLLKIQNKLNYRPRKCLDYRTPFEVMYGKTVALVT